MTGRSVSVGGSVASVVAVCGLAGVIGLAATAARGQPSAAEQPDAPDAGASGTAIAVETAGPNPLVDAAGELDTRAAAFIALRPTDLGDGFALMDLLSGIFPDVVGAFDRARDSLGLYSFSRGELAERGVDPDALVLVSWGQIDREDWVQKRAAGSSPVVWVRHRVVVKVGPEPVTDETKLQNAFAQALQKRGASIVRLPRAPGAPPAPAWTKSIASVAKRAQVRLLARGTSGDLFALRIRNGRAVVDWAEPWAGRAKL